MQALKKVENASTAHHANNNKTTVCGMHCLALLNAYTMTAKRKSHVKVTHDLRHTQRPTHTDQHTMYIVINKYVVQRPEIWTPNAHDKIDIIFSHVTSSDDHVTVMGADR